jgi:hypothetical protein
MVMREQLGRLAVLVDTGFAGDLPGGGASEGRVGRVLRLARDAAPRVDVLREGG